MNDKKKQEREYTIFWLVGESSGDLHAELVMKSLNSAIPNLTHIGIGGPKMQKQGLIPLFPFQRFAVMGFVEVLAHIFFFMKVQSRIRRLFAKHKPDLAILVDYPGLNLRIANLADEYRIAVLYFICPQFWAWKHDRVYKLKESTRHVACILPFEKEMLDIHNITCSYVGHPIAEEVNIELDRDAFAKFYKLDTKKKWIGFFPGSRNNEINMMMPTFLKAAAIWDSSAYELLFSKARSIKHNIYMDNLGSDWRKSIKLIDGYNYEMMKYCDVLICTSGTVTLEAAFIGTPLVICYKASALSYRIGKRFVRIRRIGLPNIILNQNLLPEIIQDDLSPEAVFKHADAILNDKSYNEHIRSELQKLKAMLSDKKPSEELPPIVKDLLRTYA
jgi:lipid-A-disaccharide synthase